MDSACPLEESEAAVPAVVDEATGKVSARDKFAYLLAAPAAASSGPAQATAGSSAGSPPASGACQALPAGGPSPATPPPQWPEAETRLSPSRGPAILGIRSSRCAGCGAPEAETGRVYVELGKLYCQDCWSAWERSGVWHPALRVATAPPLPGPDGVPLVRPEDAFFLPAFLCAHDDLSLMRALQSELPEGVDFSEWHGARHLGIQWEGEGARHDGPSAPPALQAAVKKLEAAFGLRVGASRLNLYRSSGDYKPLHYDRGRDSNGVPQVTVGASFGITRELTMVHVKSGLAVSFPQQNGDVFAFTPELNTVFTHGVPRQRGQVEDGPRLSLIIWGVRLSDLEARKSRAGAVNQAPEAPLPPVAAVLESPEPAPAAM